METWMWIAIAVAVVVVLAVVAYVVVRNRPSGRLKRRFGSEYDRTVEHAESKQQAHEELQGRLERHETYALRSLNDDERASYVDRWKQLQRDFVKEPATGLLEADELLTRLLADVGYPTNSFEQQAADLSAAHPDVADDYRAACAVVRDARDGRAGTEEIRRALLRYRTVFERVAETPVTDSSDEAVS